MALWSSWTLFDQFSWLMKLWFLVVLWIDFSSTSKLMTFHFALAMISSNYKKSTSLSTIKASPTTTCSIFSCKIDLPIYSYLCKASCSMWTNLNSLMAKWTNIPHESYKKNLNGSFLMSLNIWWSLYPNLTHNYFIKSFKAKVHLNTY
jgi:hypothetical protein